MQIEHEFETTITVKVKVSYIDADETPEITGVEIIDGKKLIPLPVDIDCEDYLEGEAFGNLEDIILEKQIAKADSQIEDEKYHEYKKWRRCNVNKIKERRKRKTVCSICQSPDYDIDKSLESKQLPKPTFVCCQCGHYWQYGYDGGKYKELL